MRIQPKIVDRNTVLIHLSEFHEVKTEDLPSFRVLHEKPHPDIQYFDLEESGKIEVVRRIIEAAHMQPSGEYLTIILDGIEYFTQQAANAMLKTLEDTPENVHILCLTTSPHTIIPTVRSRVQYVGHDTHEFSIDEEVHHDVLEWSRGNSEPLFRRMCGKIDKQECQQILTSLYQASRTSSFQKPALIEIISQNFERMNTSNARVKYLIDSILLADSN